MLCLNCKKEIDNKSNSCPYCGVKVNNDLIINTKKNGEQITTTLSNDNDRKTIVSGEKRFKDFSLKTSLILFFVCLLVSPLLAFLSAWSKYPSFIKIIFMYISIIMAFATIPIFIYILINYPKSKVTKGLLSFYIVIGVVLLFFIISGIILFFEFLLDCAQTDFSSCGTIINLFRSII